MTFPVREIVEAFEQETGHTVRLSLGSSGNFYGQIVNGAPFDVFLSADRNYPEELRAAGVIAAGSFEIYAEGRLVLWTRADSDLDLETLGMDAMLDPSVRRIAIANPTLAPYGRAAVAAMEREGVYDRVASKIVRGDNVSQAAQFVSSGAADIGILAMSLARSEVMAEGRSWQVPSQLHQPIEQAMVILERAERSGHLTAAREFRDMVRGPLGRTILAKYGLSVP
jgi:molybdate transport system substrate-binding protein